jgi:DNA-binding MarR family transcriptional regulator
MRSTARAIYKDRAINDALDAMRRIFRLLQLSARQAERELGISGAQLFVLQQLADGEAESLNQLAERTHTHQSSVSVVVRRLLERGLITRRASREDARRIVIALSTKGRDLLRRSGPAVQVRLIRAMGRLSPRQRDQLAALLRAVVNEMGLAGIPAPMIFTQPQNEVSRRARRRRQPQIPALLGRRQPSRAPRPAASRS